MRVVSSAGLDFSADSAAVRPRSSLKGRAAAVLDLDFLHQYRRPRQPLTPSPKHSIHISRRSGSFSGCPASRHRQFNSCPWDEFRHAFAPTDRRADRPTVRVGAALGGGIEIWERSRGRAVGVPAVALEIPGVCLRGAVPVVIAGALVPI